MTFCILKPRLWRKTKKKDPQLRNYVLLFIFALYYIDYKHVKKTKGRFGLKSNISTKTSDNSIFVSELSQIIEHN